MRHTLLAVVCSTLAIVGATVSTGTVMSPEDAGASVVQEATVGTSTAPMSTASTSLLWAQSSNRVVLRYGASNAGNPYAVVPNGTRFRMTCWAWGANTYGNYWSSKWFWGQNYATGGYSFVHSSYVYYQTWVPRC